MAQKGPRNPLGSLSAPMRPQSELSLLERPIAVVANRIAQKRERAQCCGLGGVVLPRSVFTRSLAARAGRRNSGPRPPYFCPRGRPSEPRPRPPPLAPSFRDTRRQLLTAINPTPSKFVEMKFAKFASQRLEADELCASSLVLMEASATICGVNPS